MSKIVSKLKLVLRVTKRAGKSLIKNKGNVKIHGNSPWLERYRFKSQAKPSKNR